MTAAMGHASAQDGLALPMPVRPLALTHGFNGEAADRRACELAIRRGSKSFHLASMLLPRGQREAARALYAFCRNSDDLVDDPRASLASLDRLRTFPFIAEREDKGELKLHGWFYGIGTGILSVYDPDTGRFVDVTE